MAALLLVGDDDSLLPVLPAVLLVELVVPVLSMLKLSVDDVDVVVSRERHSTCSSACSYQLGIVGPLCEVADATGFV